MKSIFYITTVVIVGLFISGCGEDRSHSSDISEYGQKNIWIYDTPEGENMVKNNFVYIPGGFDVDGDGIAESGFWLSKYEAKEDNQTERSLNISGTIEDILKDNFQVFNPTDKYKRFNSALTSASGFLQEPVAGLEGLDIKKVKFTEEGNSTRSISALEAVISLQNSQIEGGFKISLPTEKQWMHLVKLIINNPKNWTGEEVGKGKLFQGDKNSSSDRRSFVIENSILANDSYVPDNYKVDVYDLSGSVAEWTSGMIAIEDRFLTGDSGKHEYSELNNAPTWWKPILKDQITPLSSIEGVGLYHDGFSRAGTNDILEISSYGTGNVDKYAVVARGGSNSIDDIALVGISAAQLSYGPGYKGPTVGFRAASDYLY